MLESERFVAFLTAAVVLAAIPGPAMLYVAACSMSRREPLAADSGKGVHATLGTAICGGFHVIAAAVRLSAVPATSAVASTVVR